MHVDGAFAVQSLIQSRAGEKQSLLLALLYLRFALWWLDLNLLSGPDALQKGRN